MTFCHFGISNVRFAFWAFFRKPEKLRSRTGSKWWPGDPDVNDDLNDPLTRWPNDPVPCLIDRCGDVQLLSGGRRSIERVASMLWSEETQREFVWRDTIRYAMFVCSEKWPIANLIKRTKKNTHKISEKNKNSNRYPAAVRRVNPKGWC